MFDFSLPSNALQLLKPLDIAIPFFIIFMLIELTYGWKTRRIRYEGKDTLTSLTMSIGTTIAGALTAGIVLTAAYWVWENFRIFENLGSSIPIFILAFVLEDFTYYWIHRSGHRIRWLWAAHVIHHSSQHYNLSTALRQTWTDVFTPKFLFFWPLFLLGIEPAIVFFCAGLNLIYQFWFHTEAIDKCPRWFEALFNTPSHHRVHHAKNPQYLDANYAGVFIIWDKMFGTFVPEDKNEPCNYGLVHDLDTFNPLRVATHEWVGIVKDIWSAKGLKNKILFLVGPPGWTPDGSRMTSDMLRASWQKRQETAAKTATTSAPAE
ncbi:MAG: sterol desaturase family protein [Kordiimonadaceae bacterium]|nr:sterol desaturase family protein [Kordiimonadaceae bacterium]